MSIDRLERRLPDVLTELSLPVMPDYVDNLLSRTERMPQRPGWTFPERWFPVSTITNVLPAGQRLSLRPLLVIAVLIVASIISVILIAGAQSRPAPPFGLARNGLVVTTNAGGDLVAIDPATSTPRIILAGPDLCCAQISADGRRIAVIDVPVPDGDPTRLRVINLDGSPIRELPAAELRGIQDFAWSPDGKQLLLAFQARPKVLDIETGTLTTLDVPGKIVRASWIGTSGDILVTQQIAVTQEGFRTLRVLRLTAGATRPTTVATLQYVVDVPKVSPDGSKFTYFIWGPEPGQQGRLHVYDLATSTDVEVSPPQQVGTPQENQWENPVWSPDGAHIAVELYTTGPNHVVVIPANGGDPVLAGPEFPTSTGGTVIRWSPDGQSLLVTYRFDQSTWLVPVTGGEGQKVTWLVAEDADWQRLAP